MGGGLSVTEWVVTAVIFAAVIARFVVALRRKPTSLSGAASGQDPAPLLPPSR